MLHELLQELQLVQELEGLYPAGTEAQLQQVRGRCGAGDGAGAGQVMEQVRGRCGAGAGRVRGR